MMVKLDPEFQFLITLLDDTESHQLEEDLIRDGCQDPLVLWKGHDLLVDGYNRYKICQAHNLPFKTIERDFSTREDVLDWIIDNQLGRKNLTESQIAYFRVKRYNMDGIKRHGNKSDLRKDKQNIVQNIAKEYKVGKAIIERDAKFARAVDIIKENFGFDFSKKLLAEELNYPKSDVVKLAEKLFEKKHEIVKGLLASETQHLDNIVTETLPKASNKSTPAFNRTNDNIEWAKWTWNPVVGCKHGCMYCYARDIANRFYGNFEPSFKPERLGSPKVTPMPNGATEDIGLKTVFVCSMADLFGEWVPQEWIDAVLKSVRESPRWNFLFLTKNPKRMVGINWPENAWVGTTVDIQARVKPAEDAFRQIKASVRFVSCEPLQERVIFSSMEMFDWIIIGGRSRCSRLPEFQPNWRWVESLLNQAREYNLKVYFKPNLTARPKEYPLERRT